MNKTIGSICKVNFCNKRLNYDTRKVVVCSKCSTIYHKDCIKKCKTSCTNQNCDNYVFIDEDSLDPNSQDYINVLSTKKTKFRPGFFDYVRLFYRLFPLLYYYGKFWLNSKKSVIDRLDLDQFLREVHQCLNINVTTKGFEKIDPTIKKVFVGNHHSEHEALILPLYIKAGVIASISINKTHIGRTMKLYTNTLTIKRGHSKSVTFRTDEEYSNLLNNKTTNISNTVEQMKDFLMNDKNNAFFVFPTSIFDQYQTLSKFRTGAFAMGFPVQPVIIKYKQDISSMNMLHMLMLERLDVEIIVSDLIYADKNKSIQEFAEEVRNIFRDVGGLKLSNVDSHDVRD